jgi:hypothetical protein
MEITGFELKKKPRIFIIVCALLFQLLAMFGGELGLPDKVKFASFGFAVFFYSFIIIPRLNVWQKIK